MARHSIVPAEYFDMDEISRLVRSRGISCHIDQTGGGCATLFAGPKRPDPEEVGQVLHAVTGGPGSYSWDPNFPSIAGRGEFCISEGNTYGDLPIVEIAEDSTEEQIAEAIVALVLEVSARHHA